MRIIRQAFDDKGQQLSLDQLAIEYYDTSIRANTYDSLKTAIDNINNLQATTPLEQSFLSYIRQDVSLLFIGKPKEIAIICQHVDQNYAHLFIDPNGDRTTFNLNLKACISYGSYRKGEKLRWLAERLQISACVYCNAQYALTLKKKKGKQLLFEFDHFYPQRYYPFLALNIYNLIPACGNCNSVKSDQRLDLIHPYTEDASALMTYKASNNDVLDYLLNDRKRSITVNLVPLDKRITTHNDIFMLDKIANKHHDLVEELFLKTYYYSDSKKKELEIEFKGIVNNDTIQRFILGNFYAADDINKRPLAKLTQDIAKDLGLY